MFGTTHEPFIMKNDSCVFLREEQFTSRPWPGPSTLEPLVLYQSQKAVSSQETMCQELF